MQQGHIDKICTILNANLIESPENAEKRLYTFQTPKNDIVFVEEMKIRHKTEPNYYVCTNSIDCWDGYDDMRDVLKHIKNWTKGLKF